MKILKRLFAVVLTLVLSFYAVSNVAAEGEGRGGKTAGSHRHRKRVEPLPCVSHRNEGIHR